MRQTRAVIGFSARLFFEPRDIWVGVYVKAPYRAKGWTWREIYVCLMPCLPLLITLRSRR